MTAIGRQEIIEHRFETLWRGYDKAEVNTFLALVADHVEWLQNELAGQATDRTALDLLKKAERIAADTRLSAEIDAARERDVAAKELDDARLTATALIEQGQAEATRIVGEAHAQAVAIHQTAAQQTTDMRLQAEKIGEFIKDSVTDLRLGASRLNELASHFEVDLSEREVAPLPIERGTIARSNEEPGGLPSAGAGVPEEAIAGSTLGKNIFP